MSTDVKLQDSKKSASKDAAPNNYFNLGAALKKVRREVGLSLTDLASASGISHSTISRIENNKISPSWDTVVALCSALKIQINDLIEAQKEFCEAPSENVVVTRPSNASSIRFGGTGYELHYGHDTPRSFNLVVMTHENTTLEEVGGLQGHDGYEFTYVLEGTLEVLIESREPIELQPGDSIQFSSQLPHAYLRTSDEPARTLTLLSGTQQDPTALLTRLMERDINNNT